MTREQRIIVYSIVIFMMVWGIDLINAAKYHTPVEEIFHPFNFSQALYALFTFLFVSTASRRYFLPGKYVHFSIALLLTIVFFIVFRYLLEELLSPLLLGIRNYRGNVSLIYYSLDNVYYALVYIVLGFLLFLIDNQLSTQKKQAVLLQKTREAELQFLRSQINPHFLFNTLNNIYSLVYEQSEKAPAAMLRLSDMMRYMLYEKKETVPLAKEWEYINSFVELQKLRFHDDPYIDISAEGPLQEYAIPPYLLIPFVENAFKHGDLRDPALPLQIRLMVRDREVRFRVQNKISHRNKDESGGVGLDNVKRRLELIFPGRHVLSTVTEGPVFTILLTLKL